MLLKVRTLHKCFPTTGAFVWAHAAVLPLVKPEGVEVCKAFIAPIESACVWLSSIMCSHMIFQVMGAPEHATTAWHGALYVGICVYFGMLTELMWQIEGCITPFFATYVLTLVLMYHEMHTESLWMSSSIRTLWPGAVVRTLASVSWHVQLYARRATECLIATWPGACMNPWHFGVSCINLQIVCLANAYYFLPYGAMRFLTCIDQGMTPAPREYDCLRHDTPESLAPSGQPLSHIPMVVLCVPVGQAS